MIPSVFKRRASHATSMREQRNEQLCIYCVLLVAYRRLSMNLAWLRWAGQRMFE